MRPTDRRPKTDDPRLKTEDERQKTGARNDMRDYRKITAWQKADDFAVAVYEVTRFFPREETYGLVAQLRRAVCSCPANIVEGASRASKKDYLHFLYIARGSLHEAHYFVHLAHRLDYLDEKRCGSLTEQAEEASRTLTGLIRAVEREAGLTAQTVARVSTFLAINLGLFTFHV